MVQMRDERKVCSHLFTSFSLFHFHFYTNTTPHLSKYMYTTMYHGFLCGETTVVTVYEEYSVAYLFPNAVVELINRLSTGYWENTFITDERAMEDYLLEME